MHVRILAAVLLFAAHALAAREAAAPAAPPTPADRIIDCPLPSAVYLEDADGERKLVGTTPTLDWRGLRVPAGARVWLEFGDEGNLSAIDVIKDIAAGANALGVDALILECTGAIPDTFWAELCTVKELKCLGGLELSDLTAKELARFPRLATLECKPLSNAAISAIPAHAPNLERLVLTGAEFNDDGLACLEKMPALKSLRITDLKIGAAGLAHIARMKGLRRLELDFSTVEGASMALLKDKGLAYFRCAQIVLSGFDLDIRRTLGAPVMDAKDLRAFFNPKPVVDEAMAKTINALIPKLDHEDFAERQAATDKLLELPPETMPWLRNLIVSMKDSLSLEQDTRLREILAGLGTKARLGTGRLIAAELNKAVAESPAHYLAPSPKLLKKLERRVGFEFDDVSLATVRDILMPELGAPIVLDPELEHFPSSCSLRVTCMRMVLAIEWIAKLTDVQVVPRGDVVILARGDRARALRLQEVFYDLPSAKGEAPWTDAEAAWLCAVLASRTPVTGRLMPWSMGPLQLESCERTKDGRLRIVADPEAHKEIERVLAEFTHSPYQEPPLTPKWLDKIQQELDKHIDLDNVSDMRAFDAFQMATGLQVATEGEIQYSGEDITVKGTWREALLLAAEKAKAVLLPERGTLIRAQARNFVGLPAARRIFDVRPVLAAGVGPKDLAAAVKELFAPVHEDPTSEPFPLRGRFFAAVDPWTEQRVHAVLKAAAATGKIPTLPPVPWFFETLKYVPAAKGEDIAR
ncbi:MAG: hypothetical protein L6R28_05510 [Planctomycetes bacterium]|nr:hypothetical protein [Planctomycetota bacterium]